MITSVPYVAGIVPDANNELNPRNSLLHRLVAAEDPHLFGGFLMRRVIQVQDLQCAYKMIFDLLLAFPWPSFIHFLCRPLQP